MNPQSMKKSLALGLLVSLFSVSCAHHRHGEGDHNKHKMMEHMKGEGAQCEMEKKPNLHEFMHKVMSSRPKVARAEIRGLQKSKVSGQVVIRETEEGVKISIHLKGLKAKAKQGLHIHEFGNCESSDGSSAGGHYNPFEMAHASPTEAQHHVGDLGNVQADDKGEVDTEVTIGHATTLFLVGRSVVLHAKEDDFKSQPAGASGDRVACGVIGFSKE